MTINPIDALWILFSAGLVFLMQAGFLCLETGLTRSKNNINVAMKNLSDFCLSALLFWLFGYALLFGDSWSGWLGLSGTMPDFMLGDLGSNTFFIFQMMFCATAVTIVSGAIAERVNFRAYLLTVLLVSGLIYPLFGHWVWNGMNSGNAQGWLAALGFVDFAGGSVVHSVGGWVALALLLHIGPRRGRFADNGEVQTISGANIPMAALGVLLLWLGWFGFNGGSTLAFNALTLSVILNTCFAAAAGLLTGLIISWNSHRKMVVGYVLNGTVAGLVAITANAHVVSALSAIIIGAVGALVMVMASRLLLRLRIDDAVDAVAAHAFAGAWGTLAVALFGQPELLATGLDRVQQLGVQLLGVLVCFVWAFGMTALILRLLRNYLPMRVSAQDERDGLNVSEHAASTELHDMFSVMDAQHQQQDLSLRVPVEPFTEVGQIAERYNHVMDALERATSKVNAIVAHSMAGIITFSHDTWHVLSMNPAAETMFGYTATTWQQQQVCVLFKEAQATREALLAESDNAAHQTLEIDGVTLDGRTVPLEVTISRVATAYETFYTLTCQDISERKQMECVRQEAVHADAKNRAKGDFLATMSHEIRTPMNAIIGLNQLALQTELSEKQYDYLKKVDTASHNLLGIINDILDFSKIEEGKMTLESIDFNLESVLEQLATISSVRANEKDLELCFYHESDVPLMLKGDALRLGQVLLNLVGNAIKFTEQGSIMVRIARQKISDDGHITLAFSVADQGIGMTQEQLDRLFQPFEQADASTTRNYGGTGLGLVISKQLVELMGGEISVTSEQGKGTVFHFTATFSPGEAEHAQRFMTAESLQGMRVLVVDDNADTQYILQSYLRDFSLRVSLADCGREAIRLLQEAAPLDPFDVVLLDWQMPDMCGDEVAKHIRQRMPMIPQPKIIMVTAFGREEVRQQAERVGADGLLLKPVSQSLLFDTLMDKFEGSGGQIKSPTVLPLATQPQLTGAQILLVEDNLINQQVASEILQQYGMVVTIANNGEEALVRLQEQSFDLVLMDLQMPVMDGYSATRAIRQDARFDSLPIIAMTAHAMTEERQRCLDAGMNDHTTKPIDREALLRMLEKWLEALVNHDAPRQAPQPPAIEAPYPGVDLPRCMEKIGGEQELIERLLLMFAKQFVDSATQLQQWLSQGEREHALEHLHELKGTAGNLCADTIFAAAIELEDQLLDQAPYDSALENLAKALSDCRKWAA